MSHDFVTHIQGSRLQLRISTVGPLCSWEHETYFHFQLEVIQLTGEGRGVTCFLVRCLQPLHFAATRLTGECPGFQTTDSSSRSKSAESPELSRGTMLSGAFKYDAKQRSNRSQPEKVAWSFPLF
ncbi:Hypothetical_protein [Hexamita inflata]|uniref:Hypothetical_protein n=1 Tax=Hexamita inflata TaxID=28002 RepID=A0AA86PBZ5_9EUKA|nr:Hypothetical protein HINF_LOCUS23457 [Hexamita inflata]